MCLAQSPAGDMLAMIPRVRGVSHTRSGNAAYFLFRAIFNSLSCGLEKLQHETRVRLSVGAWATFDVG